MKQVDKITELQTLATLYEKGRITQRAESQVQRTKLPSSENKPVGQEFVVIYHSRNKNLIIPYQ